MDCSGNAEGPARSTDVRLPPRLWLTEILVFIPFTVAKLGDLRRIGAEVDKEIVRPRIFEIKDNVNGVLQFQLASFDSF